MAEREPNLRLADVMRRASCSNSGLAKRVSDVAQEHGVEVRCDHVNVKRWLSGTRPRGMTPHFIAEALSRKLGEPLTLAEVGMTPNDQGALLSSPTYPERLSESVDVVVALVRADLAGSSTAGSGNLDPHSWSDLMIGWLVAPDMTEATEGATLTPSPAEALARATSLFSEIDYRFGGGYARSALVQFISSEVAPLLAERPLTSDLLRETSALLRLTGWTAYDTGHHQLAHHYLTQALRLAQACGERALGGRILAGMSHQANFLGYHNSAANLARAARAGATGVATPTGMALFHAMEARALAGRGDRRGCELALVEADRWFAHRVPDDDPTWLRYFDEAELAAEFAHSYRDLGFHNKAVEYAQIAIDNHDPMYARSIFFCRTVLAAGHLGKGEIEQALMCAELVVTGSAALRSDRSVAYLRDFVERLARYGTQREVADFIERVGHSP